VISLIIPFALFFLLFDNKFTHGVYFSKEKRGYPFEFLAGAFPAACRGAIDYVRFKLVELFYS